MEWSLCELCPA